ncbi:hypothetical protein [Helicobacter felis]|uniref:hypothetical protein n=1 Tax=Helicobacter felis TaxID=214 RepID=UPI000CF08BD6|nr:hypothetical protein [Helicobacter felis]
MTLLVRGHLPYGAKNPIFVPEEVNLASSKLGAHEQEIEVACIRHDRSMKIANNVANKAWVNQLPKYALETSRRLEEWLAYLKFKEKFIAFHMGQKFLLLGADFIEKRCQCVAVLRREQYQQHLDYIRSKFKEFDGEIMPLNAFLEPINFKPSTDSKKLRNLKSWPYKYVGCLEIDLSAYKECHQMFEKYIQTKNLKNVKIEDYRFLQV